MGDLFRIDEVNFRDAIASGSLNMNEISLIPEGLKKHGAFTWAYLNSLSSEKRKKILKNCDPEKLLENALAKGEKNPEKRSLIRENVSVLREYNKLPSSLARIEQQEKVKQAGKEILG